MKYINHTYSAVAEQERILIELEEWNQVVENLHRNIDSVDIDLITSWTHEATQSCFGPCNVYRLSRKESYEDRLRPQRLLVSTAPHPRDLVLSVQSKATVLPTHRAADI